MGVVLGAMDGLSAWLTPAVRTAIVSIVIGGAFKSAIVGLCAGFFARRVHSTPMGILFGGALGVLFAFGIASMPAIDGNHYYVSIMVPGTLAGMILGWATQTHAEAAKSRAAGA